MKIRTHTEKERREYLERLKAENAENEQEEKRGKFPSKIQYRFKEDDNEAKPEENPATDFLLLVEGHPIQTRKRRN